MDILLNSHLDHNLLEVPLKFKEIKPNETLIQLLISSPVYIEPCLTTDDSKLLKKQPQPLYYSCAPKYLQVNSYLSEFDTPASKLKARINLGIDDTALWGKIKGYIEDQKDLMDYLANIPSNYEGIEVIPSLSNYDKILKIGQCVYVIDEDTTYQFNGEVLTPLNKIVVSTTEPENKQTIWIDPSGEAMVNLKGNLSIIQQQIQSLQTQVNKLMKIINFGVVAGDSTLGTRVNMISNSVQPSAEGLFPTVPHLSIKMDTLANFIKNRRNLIDGELVWITDQNRLYIYLDGKFKPTSSGGSINNNDSMTKEDIEELYFNNLGLIDKNNKQYHLRINEDGNIIVYDSSTYDGEYLGTSLETTNEVGGSYISNYLRINSLFFGGIGTKIDSFCGATHNFIELANASDKDINLNGMYLLYRGDSTPIYWDALELHGIIKSGSTFLIRGAKCSAHDNTNINVVNYDMLWYDSSGKLKEFDSNGGSFYLVVGLNKLIYNPVTNSYIDYNQFPSSVNPYSTSIPIGYVDLVGIGENKPAEGGKPLVPADKITDCVFFRLYSLDPGYGTVLKVYAKRSSAAFWTYCNMTKNSNPNFPYFTETLKQRLSPKAAKENKNFYSNKTVFDETKPNAITMSFGIQATDDGSGATRCFNWVSVGYYDEYLEYKKVEDSDWIRVYSYDGNNSTDVVLNTYSDVYKRLRWVTSNQTAVTTHKVIVRNLTKGLYLYRIGRNENYLSEEKEFTIKSGNTFNFLHISDLLGFNYNEYCAWLKSASAIQDHLEYDFIINTGDMTQSGNRENEWLDYIAGRELLGSVPEMACIGNNDLCGVDLFKLGKGVASSDKINSLTIWLFYTFELDINNSPYFIYKRDTTLNPSKLHNVIESTEFSFKYFVPSIYSFNYGDYHFICLNSEFAVNSGVYNVYYLDATIEQTFKTSYYYQLYKWLEKDIQNYPDKHYICYHHEIPFNIVKVGESGLAIARSITNGSQLNYDFSSGINYTDYTDSKDKYAGGFCFSEFFLNNKIRLVLGGHKHTYSMSYPIVENVTTKNNQRQIIPTNPYIVGLNENTESIPYINPVVYCMSQATGFKLTSNKDIPGALKGSPNSNWLYHFYPCDVNNNINSGQKYPMCLHVNCIDSIITIKPYAIDHVYEHSETSVTDFNINKQLYAPKLIPLKNLVDDTDRSCSINYSSGKVEYT